MANKIRGYRDMSAKDYTETKAKSPAEVEINGPETTNGTVINSIYVKVRKEPNYESEVLELLRKGDKVRILGRNGEFYIVSTNTISVAYISSDFIKED